MASRADIQLLV